MSEIDLSRYEGHTPGEWATGCYTLPQPRKCQCRYIFSEHYEGSIATVSKRVGESFADEGFNDSPPESEAIANGLLMADAPLLAAEVASLREQLEAARADARELVWAILDGPSGDDWEVQQMTADEATRYEACLRLARALREGGPRE